jgi:serine/threonine-protein kinase
VHDSAIAPSQANPLVPQALSEIVMKCLAKAPSARYARGNDLADALIQYLRSSADGSTPYRMAAIARRAGLLSGR